MEVELKVEMESQPEPEVKSEQEPQPEPDTDSILAHDLSPPSDIDAGPVLAERSWHGGPPLPSPRNHLVNNKRVSQFSIGNSQESSFFTEIIEKFPGRVSLDPPPQHMVFDAA